VVYDLQNSIAILKTPIDGRLTPISYRDKILFFNDIYDASIRSPKRGLNENESL
jgi:hypothetical protein